MKWEEGALPNGRRLAANAVSIHESTQTAFSECFGEQTLLSTLGPPRVIVPYRTKTSAPLGVPTKRENAMTWLQHLFLFRKMGPKSYLRVQLLVAECASPDPFKRLRRRSPLLSIPIRGKRTQME
jgi:hypothetical protein